MTDFSNMKADYLKNFTAFSSSPLQQVSNNNNLITPFDCNNSPAPGSNTIPNESLIKEKSNENNEDILKTAKKSKITSSNQNSLNVKKIKEIISSLDAKTPFHLIFDCDESPSFEAQFKEFVAAIQESEKNPISVLHELCHNLKVEINVQVDPKLQGLDKNNRNVRYYLIFNVKYLVFFTIFQRGSLNWEFHKISLFFEFKDFFSYLGYFI